MATGKKRGRPTRLTSEVRNRILERLRAGDRFLVACRAANIGVHAGLEWLRRGKGEDDRPPAPVYVEFAKEVEATQDEMESAAIQAWRKSIEGGEKRRRSQKKMVQVPDGKSPTGYSYIVTEEITTEESMFPDWRAAVAWLERNLPEFYAPPHKHKLSGKDGKSIGVIMLPAPRGTADEHGGGQAGSERESGIDFG